MVFSRRCVGCGSSHPPQPAQHRAPGSRRGELGAASRRHAVPQHRDAGSSARTATRGRHHCKSDHRSHTVYTLQPSAAYTNVNSNFECQNFVCVQILFKFFFFVHFLCTFLDRKCKLHQTHVVNLMKCFSFHFKGAVSRMGTQRKVRRHYVDYGASGAVFWTFRTYCDVPIGHVTNLPGGGRVTSHHTLLSSSSFCPFTHNP